MRKERLTPGVRHGVARPRAAEEAGPTSPFAEPPPRPANAAAAPEPSNDAPIGRVVFGIDFGPASLGAARWAVRWIAGQGTPTGVRPDGARLLAHVVPWPDGTGAFDVTVEGERSLRAMRPALLGGLAGFAATLPVASSRPVVRVGRPSACLSALAAEERADLVVLGRRRDAARHRIGEPNVVERVARRAGCDVLVVPEGVGEPLRRVIAAVDAGPATAGVVARALALARTHGAALALVHVLSPAHGSYDRLVPPRARRAGAPVAPACGAGPGETACRDAAYAWLGWLARDAGPRIACTLTVPAGDAGRELAAIAAAADGPNLVVLGKRGADGAPRGSLGSVARDLVARSAAPVLLAEHEADGPRVDAAQADVAQAATEAADQAHTGEVR